MSLLSSPNSKALSAHKTDTNTQTLPRLLPLSEPSIKVITGLLVISDGLLAGALFMLAFWLRHPGKSFLIWGHWPVASWNVWLPVGFQSDYAPYLSVLYFVPLVQVLTFWFQSLYRVRGEFSFSEDFINIFKAVSIGALLVTMLAFFYRGGFAYAAFSYSRVIFILFFLLNLTLSLVYRSGLRSLQTFYRRRHMNVIPILIVGSNSVAEMCVNEIAHDPKLGRRVVGFITSDGKSPKSQALQNWPTLGRYDEMHRFIRLYSIGEVLITDPDIPTQMLFDTMVKCGRGSRVAFRIVPNLLNCIPRKTCVEQLGAVPMVRLFEEPLSGAVRLFKRSIDVMVSLLILLVTAPLWLIMALAIKLESRGPIFYRQERVGMDGHIFLLYKFRSMTNDVEIDEAHREYMQRVIKKEGGINLGTEDEPNYKFINDARLTRIGKWLRQTSLDELPQLFNVFKGEMSLVGPRPPIPYEVECYEAWHRKRLDVKPGMTGLWQVSGRYHLSFDQMVQLDIYYIENWSPWLDLKIILKTLPALFMQEQP